MSSGVAGVRTRLVGVPHPHETAAQEKPSGGGPYGIDFLKEKRFGLSFTY
jgi:hypothetical protein